RSVPEGARAGGVQRGRGRRAVLQRAPAVSRNAGLRVADPAPREPLEIPRSPDRLFPAMHGLTFTGTMRYVDTITGGSDGVSLPSRVGQRANCRGCVHRRERG